MRKAWMVLSAVYLAGVAVVISQFKVPPVMGFLQSTFNLNLTQAGWLMSIFSVAGIILAVPAAVLIEKFGAKATALIALGCSVLGSLMGSFIQSAEGLLISRLVEGVGLGLIAVAGPALIAGWFPPEKRALPMGIWASWVPVGTVVAFNLANPITRFLSWQGMWYMSAAVSLAVLAYFAVVVSNPQRQDSEAAFSFVQEFKSKGAWLLGLGFAGFGFANSGFITFAAQYFNEAHGVLAEHANFYASLSSLVGIGGTVVGGYLITRTQKTKQIYLLSACMTTVLFGYVYMLPGAAWIIPWTIIMGVFPSFFATANFTLAPETVSRPEYAGVSLAINNLLFNVGFLIGPPLTGSFIGEGNWQNGAYPIIVALLVTTLAAIGLHRLLKSTPGKEGVKE